MRRLRRAKIVATLGPASSDAATIARLFEAGADVFRINMSHTSQDRMRELIAMIRGIEKDTGRPIGILVDLQGPKLRLGTFTGGGVDGGQGRQLRARYRSGAGRRHARVSAASGDFRRGGARPHAADRRRQGAPDRHRRPSPSAWSRASRSAGKLVRPQGREPARHHHSVFRAGGEGPLRSRSRAGRRHRLGRAVLHPAAGGHRRGQEDHARARRGDGQDREAAGGATGSPKSSILPTR